MYYRNLISNITKAFIAIMVSLLILIPFSFHMNKSYYRTIYYVNKNEINELSPLITYLIESHFKRNEKI